MRFEVRVKPGASATKVGGTWGEDRALNVMVTKRAVDGQANAAVIDLLASVFRVRKRQLEIVGGHTHRTKVIEIADPPDDFADRLEHWRQRG